MARLSTPASAEEDLRLFESALGDQRFADALDRLRALPDEIRARFDLRLHEAQLVGRLGRHEEEYALYEALSTIHPDSIGLRLSMAFALKTLGRGKQAAQVLRKAIATAPDDARPWWLLSTLEQGKFTDKDVAAMRDLVGRLPASPDRAPLHFAIGKAFEQRREAGPAFDQYAAGNALRAEAFGRKRIAVAAKAARAAQIFTTEFFAARAGWGHGSEAPIFVVGVQRSGSSLVEQILASHPSIEGASELPFMSQVMREAALDPSGPAGDAFDRLAALGPERVRQLGQTYLDRAAQSRHTDRPRFVDKLPGNWSNIGLIRLILPNARIVDARRHPMAAGWSNFKTYFGDGSFFSCDLVTIGEYYRAYLRLVTHFEKVAPDRIHRVVNEALIGEFEGQVRALLDHVGVEFDAACLDFHRNARAVRTPSAEQVRRPVNAEGVDAWRAFEPHLDSLKRALGPALDGWNLPPGAYRDEQDMSR